MATSRILVIEPDHDSAKRLQKAFEVDGHKVLVAYSGQEAWDTCRQWLPQAILLDIDLPDIDGYELLRRIRGTLRTQHIPVTVLTERRERRDKIASLEMGADDYIPKPYDIEEVRLRIRNVLQQAQAGRLIDPVTGLPGNRLIQEQMRELLRRRDKWAVLRVIIRHLDAFADAYGFLAGEDVLRTTTRIVSEALDKWGGTNDFVGHSGGDEFIIITSAEAAMGLSPSLSRDLEEVGRTHYSLREREQGFVTIRQTDGSQRKGPLLTINVQMVTAADGPFHDIMELTRALG